MNRRGIALPIALLTLLLLGALAGAVLATARVRWRGGERALQSLQVRTLAESEVERAIVAWDPLRADSLAIGGIVGIPSSGGVGGLLAQDSLLRLGRGLFLVRAVGMRMAADGAMLARDAAARLVRLVVPAIPDTAAVLASGPVMVDGLAQVDGGDRVPVGWGSLCVAPASGGAGVIAGVTASVTPACSGGPCISGVPAIGTDSTLTPARLARLGPVSVAELIAIADRRVSGLLGTVRPVLAGAACGLADSLNWGDPGMVSAPCGRFFPVIRAAPFTRITGGQGQGLLIGTGPLELGGDAEFSGVVFAAGPLIVRGQARVTGVVVSQDSLTVADSAVIGRSRCAVGRALAGVARPVREVERGWFRWD